MKILYVTNRSEIFSGGQISLLEFLSGLDRSRFEPVALCPGEGGMSERLRSLGIKVYLWDMSSVRTFNILKIREKALELRDVITDCGADIIHTNGSRAQFYAALALKNMDAHLVWHVRESIRDIPIYDRFLGSSAARIICVSRAVRKERFGGYPNLAPKIQVIYNGVDTNKFFMDKEKSERTRGGMNIRRGDVLLGIIGLLVPLKGHPVLFEALKILAEKHPEVRLLVLGKTVDEAYGSRLRKMVRDMGIGEKVIFSPPRDDVKTVLSALDIFVLPSQREGFSRVLLEAMACSTPIIASNVGGNNEAIVDGESGLLVPCDDVMRLTEAIERLIAGIGFREKIGLKARERVKNYFSIEKNILLVQKQYEELKALQAH